MCYKAALHGWTFLTFLCRMSSAILGSLAEMEISSNIIMSDDPVIIISFSKPRCHRPWELKDYKTN